MADAVTLLTSTKEILLGVLAVVVITKDILINVLFLFFFFTSLSTTQPTLLTISPRNTKGHSTVPVSLIDSPIFAKPYNHIIQRDPALKRRFQELAPVQSLSETLGRVKPDPQVREASPMSSCDELIEGARGESSDNQNLLPNKDSPIFISSTSPSPSSKEQSPVLSSNSNLGQSQIISMTLRRVGHYTWIQINQRVSQSSFVHSKP
ncbi:hypothetical protein PENPOL_c002G09063 [Penicillium polonicum]|uniref:Uncharacterized protein n=1 Tax=Penicillium polonicum TaxID=60169 RepID=A0A1V6NXW3_PENPO|nr:hypothetical protein PENPOL_c002G09063 [Penicillium polonicum]